MFTANGLTNDVYGIAVTRFGKIAIYQFGFTADEAFVFVPGSTPSATISKYAYPAGGKPLQSVGLNEGLSGNPAGLVVASPTQP